MIWPSWMRTCRAPAGSLAVEEDPVLDCKDCGCHGRIMPTAGLAGPVDGGIGGPDPGEASGAGEGAADTGVRARARPTPARVSERAAPARASTARRAGDGGGDGGAVKFYAISDCHVCFRNESPAVGGLSSMQRTGSILAGDFWARRRVTCNWPWRWPDPAVRSRDSGAGNHELWSLPSDPDKVRGEARYLRCVEICRELGVLTPEDPYPVWPGAGPPCVVVPLFLLYDYSFRPDDVRRH